jgi:hypothetical protein
MRVWVGHYQGNPKEWFVVWAKDEREAFLQIDPIVAEPDMTSLKELRVPGFVNFTVNFDRDIKVENMKFLPPKEDVESGYWLVFGGALGQIDDTEEYVFRVASGKGKRRS